MFGLPLSIRFRFRAPDHRRPDAGFALVIALGLMAFILLLLVALTTFVRVESQASGALLERHQAKENARLGAMVALGNLQRMAGPDNRVTARAAVLEDAAPIKESARRWTGIWSSAVSLNYEEDNNVEVAARINDDIPENGRFLGWLVSGGEISATDPAEPEDDWNDSNSVEILSAASDPARDPRQVRVPRIDLSDESGRGGGFAYWGIGENSKANVTAFDDYDQIRYDSEAYRAMEPPYSSAGENYEKNEFLERQRLRQIINRQLRLEPVLGAIDLPERDSMRSVLDRMTGADDLDLLVDGVDAEVLGDYVHDLTTFSFSVLANVPEGRLKYDLSDHNYIINRGGRLNAHRNGTPGSVKDNLGTIMGDAPGLSSRSLGANLVRRSALNPDHPRQNTSYGSNRYRDWSGLEDSPSIDYPHDLVYVHSAPDKLLLITEIGIKVTVYQSDENGRTPFYNSEKYGETTAPGDPGYNEYYALAFQVFAEVWNPYNHIVRANPGSAFRNVGLKIEGLPTLTISGNGPTRTIDLDDYFDSLVFDTASMGVFMPGQIKLGVLGRMYGKQDPNDNGSTGTDFYSVPNQTYENGYSWPFRKNPSDNLYNTMTLESYDPADLQPIPIFHIVTDQEAQVGTISGGVPAKPSFTVQFGPVADGDFEYVETDATIGAGGSRREIAGAFDGGSRSEDNGYSPDFEPFNFGWGNTLGPDADTADAHRLFFIEFLRNLDIRKKDDLPFRQPIAGDDFWRWSADPIRNGDNEPSTEWIDTGGDRFFFADPEFNGPGYVLYEFNRQEPLSPMALTFESARQPYAIGNPWGGDGNRVFDSIFFSSLPRIPRDASGDRVTKDSQLPFDVWNAGLPNNFLMVYQDDFNRAVVGEADVGQVAGIGSIYYNEESLSGMMRADQAAANLLLRSGFNVNSTSVDAWKVILAGSTIGEAGTDPFLFRGEAEHPREGPGPGKPLYQSSAGGGDGDGEAVLENAHFQFSQSGDSIPYYYNREALENLAAAAGGGGAALKEFQRVALSQGIRELSQEQIDFLAESLVEEIKKYVAGLAPYGSEGGKPFMSVRDFMNSGVLDTILDPSYGGGSDHPNAVVAEYPYAPAYLSQAHLLSGAAHLLTPRSDTFTIRSYGDVAGIGTNSEGAGAICEMIVQRVPTPVDRTSIPEIVDLSDDDGYRDQKLAINDLDPAEHPFGRKFEIVSFRWLDE